MCKKNCCGGNLQNNSDMNPMVMSMMMQQSNNPQDALSRVVGQLNQNGQYSPAMANYLGNVLQGIPAIPGQPPVAGLPPPTAPSPLASATPFAPLAGSSLWRI